MYFESMCSWLTPLNLYAVPSVKTRRERYPQFARKPALKAVQGKRASKRAKEQKTTLNAGRPPLSSISAKKNDVLPA